MPEIFEKLNHFTATVLSDATTENDQRMKAMEEKRQIALTSAENDALSESFHYIKQEVARIRAEAGKQVSRHMLDNQKALYLRREEIAKAVFHEVREKIAAFTQSELYSKRLRELLLEALHQLGEHFSITLYLRTNDMDFAEELKQAAGEVYVDVMDGSFLLGGLIIECPQKQLRFDATFDTALAELDGHFAELFGLSLASGI